MDYTAWFHRLLEGLNQNKAVRVEKAKIRSGLEDYMWEILQETHGVVLEDELSAFYEQVNGVDIRWSIDPQSLPLVRQYEHDDLSSIGGKVIVRPLEDALFFDERLLDASWSAGMNESDRADLEHFRYIDDNDDDVRVGFVIENRKISDELLYLVRHGEGFCPVGCGFDDYLEALIEAKGFGGWQRAFIFRESEMLFRESRLAFYLPQVFPEPVDTKHLPIYRTAAEPPGK